MYVELADLVLVSQSRSPFEVSMLPW